MPEPTFNQQMVTKLQALILQCAGAQSVSVDGVTVQLKDLERQLEFYEKRVSREQGKSPLFVETDLS